MNSQLFQQISIDLTGEQRLAERRSGELAARLRAVADAAILDRFAAVVAALPPSGPERERAIRSQLFDDVQLRDIARMVVLLWFTGDPIGKGDPGPTEEQYFDALLWPVARAHPPGLSGGYFGHWTYPPDN